MKVEKGIPIPRGNKSRSKYPWLEMEVGDSFFTTESAHRVRCAADKRQQKWGEKYTVKKVEGGVRCWRTV